MKVHTARMGNVVLARLVGEIDTVDTEGLGEALAEIAAERPEGVVLDFAGVTYVASVGLSLLLKLAQDLRKSKGKMVIAAVSPAVRTVLDTVRLDHAIPIETTVEAALARIGTKAAVPA